MMRRIIPAAVCLGLVSFFAPASRSYACTLWAAVGEAVKGGGALIAKNRDWTPDHIQELRLVQPKEGFAYFGLFAPGKRGKPVLKAGVNRPGLAAVDARAATISGEERAGRPALGRLLARLLGHCGSVAGALAHRPWLSSPGFILLADRTEIAMIEIGTDGKIDIAVIQNGTAAHANLFLAPALSSLNRGRPAPGSVQRLARIRELLAGEARALTLDDFIGFSLDRRDGPDRSVWRTGVSPETTRTLASWIVFLPPAGEPLLFVRLANPGEAVRELTLRPEQIFQAGTFPVK